MNIIFFCEGSDGQIMLDSLRQALQTPDNKHTIYNAHDSTEIIDRANIDAAVVWQPPPEFFDDLPTLKFVFALAAGVDQLLQHPGLPPQAGVFRLKDAGMSTQMAEYVLYGVLRAQRRFDQYERAQRESSWIHGLPVKAAHHVRISILGAGILGAAVAERLTRNGYPVACWSRTPKSLDASIVNYHGANELPELLAQSDVLVCLLPLTASTEGILNRSLFDQLPHGAFLINVARGAHLIEADLIDALDQGHLSGAMLDVFENEPLPGRHPFWQHPAILITPHEAARSLVEESISQVVCSINQLELDQTPASLVERSRGY